MIAILAPMNINANSRCFNDAYATRTYVRFSLKAASQIQSPVLPVNITNSFIISATIELTSHIILEQSSYRISILTNRATRDKSWIS